MTEKQKKTISLNIKGAGHHFDGLKHTQEAIKAITQKAFDRKTLNRANQIYWFDTITQETVYCRSVLAASKLLKCDRMTLIMYAKSGELYRNRYKFICAAGNTS